VGQHVAAYVLMGVHESLTTLVTVSVVAAVVFVDRIRDGYVFLTSAIWVWILRVSSYYLPGAVQVGSSEPTSGCGSPYCSTGDDQARRTSQSGGGQVNPPTLEA
jgi:hypothetical protein